MSRSKHEAYFAQLWEQQAAKRERFSTGLLASTGKAPGCKPEIVAARPGSNPGESTNQTNAAATDARPSTSRGGVVPVPTSLAVAPIQRAEEDAAPGRAVQPESHRRMATNHAAWKVCEAEISALAREIAALGGKLDRCVQSINAAQTASCGSLTFNAAAAGSAKAGGLPSARVPVVAAPRQRSPWWRYE